MSKDEQTHLVSGLNQPQSSLSAQMRGNQSVGLPTGDFRFAVVNNDGMCNNSNEAINVGTHVNLDHVAILKNHIRFTVQGWKVADAIVDRDAARKSNSWKKLKTRQNTKFVYILE